MRIMDKIINRYILGQRVDHITYERVTDQIVAMAQSKQAGYVCISNVHMIMVGVDEPKFRKVVNNATLIAPDGVPLVWCLTLQGVKGAQRVHGPTLTPILCKIAAERGVPVGFYGGTEEALEMLQKNLCKEYPNLNISYAYSPPFRRLTDEEDQQVIDDILASGTEILFVGIGCPKQEKWMAAHKDRLPLPMLGVGAAFDIISGMKLEAPNWMQKIGMEWFFRLITEPKRLWRRYLLLNPRFVGRYILQLLRLRSSNEY